MSFTFFHVFLINELTYTFIFCTVMQLAETISTLKFATNISKIELGQAKRSVTKK